MRAQLRPEAVPAGAHQHPHPLPPVPVQRGRMRHDVQVEVPTLPAQETGPRGRLRVRQAEAIIVRDYFEILVTLKIILE